MDTKKQNVVFRRIRGRIIPIRLSPSEKKEAKHGAAFAAAGLTVAATGGAAYKAVANTAYKFAQKAAVRMSDAPFVKKGAQMSFDDLIKINAAKADATRLMITARKFEKAVPYIRIGSTIAGATLLSFGTAKLFRALANKKQKNKAEKIGAGAGAVTTLAFLAGMNTKAAKTVVVNRFKSVAFKKTTQAIIEKFLKGF